MKIKVVLMFFIVAWCAEAQQHYSDEPSVHGMVVVGKQMLYASHLPMFRSPHDYQIILRLRISEADHKQYLSDRRKHPKEQIYTLAPEVFVLPQKVKHEKRFKANIYRGHFERGGEKILDTIEIEIAEVIYFKPFENAAKRPNHLQYILFGNAEEQFLAHRISKQPDFDEILQVDVAKRSKALFAANKFVLVEFPEKEIGKPYSWKKSKARIIDTGRKIKLTKQQRIYLEYGDLR